jgi:hypothetical protein
MPMPMPMPMPMQCTMQWLALVHPHTHRGAPPQVKNVLALDYCLADELSVPVRQLVDGMLQINPDDRAAACSLTERALPGPPSRLCTAALWAPQQSLGRLGPGSAADEPVRGAAQDADVAAFTTPGSSTIDLTREPWVLASGALRADDGDGAHARAARGGEAEALECAECGSTGKLKAAGSAGLTGGWRRLALYALYAVVLWAMLLVHRRSAALAASAAGADLLPGREGGRAAAGVTGLKGMLPRDSL